MTVSYTSGKRIPHKAKEHSKGKDELRQTVTSPFLCLWTCCVSVSCLNQNPRYLTLLSVPVSLEAVQSGVWCLWQYMLFFLFTMKRDKAVLSLSQRNANPQSIFSFKAAETEVCVLCWCAFLMCLKCCWEISNTWRNKIKSLNKWQNKTRLFLFFFFFHARKKSGKTQSTNQRVQSFLMFHVTFKPAFPFISESLMSATKIMTVSFSSTPQVFETLSFFPKKWFLILTCVAVTRLTNPLHFVVTAWKSTRCFYLGFLGKNLSALRRWFCTDVVLHLLICTVRINQKISEFCDIGWFYPQQLQSAFLQAFSTRRTAKMNKKSCFSLRIHFGFATKKYLSFSASGMCHFETLYRILIFHWKNSSWNFWADQFGHLISQGKKYTWLMYSLWLGCRMNSICKIIWESWLFWSLWRWRRMPLTRQRLLNSSQSNSRPWSKPAAVCVPAEQSPPLCAPDP